MREIDMLPVIETKRLFLREITNDDLQELYSLYSHADVAKGMGINPLADIRSAQDLLDYFKQSFIKKTMIRFALALKDEKKLIGTIGLQDIKWEYYLSEIGFDLNPEYHNKGYMSEALQSVIDYGFTRLRLQKLFALSYVENVVAHSVLERCGFMKEGRLLQHNYNWGTKEFADMYAYGLINNEWCKND